ncbi:MAG TPA: DUF6152 family protein [Steroidobacteraceae bacterium]
MKLRVATMVAGLLTLGSTGAAFAHHSFAMFDETKETTLVGTIKEVQWTNPHIWVQVLAKNDKGQDVEWSIEGGSPNGLTRQGWKRSSLKAGDKIEMVIHPLKNGQNGGSLMRVSVDGKPVGGQRPA